jgi:hypothetical protein
MQREGGNGSKQSHEETQDKRELPVGNVFLSPSQKLLSHRLPELFAYYLYFRMTVTSPFSVSLMMLEGVCGFFS